MILTPDQRLRVFVSSTLTELAAERAAVRRTIEALRLAPVMFEMAARPHPPRALYRAYLEQSHIFIGLYWESYGWTAEGMSVSGLEDEYRLSGDRPKLIYVKEPADRDPRLDALLAEIKTHASVSYRRFTTAEELADLVANDLAVVLTEHFNSVSSSADQSQPAIAPGRLPASATSFVGRSRDVAELRTLLRDPSVRLVTLTGAGGIGKSRLALEAAGGLSGDFGDGVRFISLSHVSEAALVIPTIASQLGVRADDQHVVRSGLLEALRDRRMLLILDNFEQIVAAASEVALLLERLPNLKAIVTSRRVLHVRGEHTYAVGRLPVPAQQITDEHELREYPAAELFVERARAVRPQLHLTQAEIDAVAELTRRLDGVPLAIELAAARVRLLPPSMLLARISGSLDVLGGALADLPERQRSLRATLDWSHNLLASGERELFRRLSVFAGSFSLTAAEHICGEPGDELDTLDRLSSLVEDSLVVVDGADPSEPRFRLLNPVREYARERLEAGNDAEHVDTRHTDYYCALCDEAAAYLLGPEQTQWLEVLERETGNLASAARRLSDGGAFSKISLTAWNIWPWLWLRSHMTEARYWLSAPLVAAETLEPADRARVVWLMGSCMFEQGDYSQGRQLLEWSAELFAELGDRHGEGLAALMLGSLAAGDEQVERATQYYANSLQALHDAGDHFAAAVVGASFGLHTVMNLNNAEEADRLLAGAQVDAEAIANEPMVRMAHLYQGFAQFVRGDVAAAKARIWAVVEAGGDGTTAELLSYGLDGLGAVALAQGDAARAATLMGAAGGLRERRGLSSWPLTRHLLDTLAAAVRSQLPAHEFDIAWSAGHALDADAARRFALQEQPTTTPADAPT